MSEWMKIKALAPWYGGKRTLAPRIVQELGDHKQYFEPFCGSAAVLFAKNPVRNETVNDLHGGLICIARVVSDEHWAVTLFDRLQRTLFSEDLLLRAQDYLESVDPPLDCLLSQHVEYAYWYFLASWMARNGVAGQDRVDFQAAVRWTAGGGSPTIRFQSAIDSLPAWHRRLKNVVILCRDAFKIIPKFEDSAATAIYVDPPYPKDTRSSTQGYKHDFADPAGGLFDDQHAQLADMLKAYGKTRIVVSTYDCEEYRELYRGWTFVDCSMLKNLAAQNARGSNSKSVAPEVLIVNGPSFTAKGTP